MLFSIAGEDEMGLCSLRYEATSGGEREIQRTMLELLNQLDGFDSRSDVKVSHRISSTLSISKSETRPS